jgi:Contractile injection system tube protein
MAPSKLNIHPVGRKDPITVRFNPNTYSITKAVEWRTSAAGASNEVSGNAPVLSFGGGGSRELTLQLFFDSTENKPDARDVRLETDEIVRLTRIDPKKGRPPVCTVAWDTAKRADFPFTGMISNLKQTFVLFDQTGTPLRATLDVTFIEFLNRDDDAKATDSGIATAVASLGQSLATIASTVFGDPAKWRDIAIANGIENPFDLPAGTNLTLPKQ